MRTGTRGGVVKVVALAVVALLAVAVTSWLMWDASAGKRGTQADLSELLKEAPQQISDEAVVDRIRAFCGDCHAVPLPKSFPRAAWHDEVRKGYEFYSHSGRTDLDPPPMYQTVKWYRAQAPEQLEFVFPKDAAHELGTTFREERFLGDKSSPLVPAVSHVHWLQLEADSDPLLVVCDMRGGAVSTLSLRDRKATQQTLAKLKNPCHVEPCDFDANGTIDLIVADLGSYSPADHEDGRVLLIPQAEDGTFAQPIELATGLGRVADVQPCDVDNDDDLDLIVAEFGMHRTGRILLLRDVSGPDEPRRFEPETLDARPGASHIPLVDLNDDGRLDFIALISQHYEQVGVYLNQEGMNQPGSPFRMKLAWEAPDLTYGSSGITLVDLDSDDDLDVLYTNGDAFDNYYLNPSHGVQWLENEGNLQFTYHRLTDLVGAYGARAGDLDMDGDQDIIAVAWTPGKVQPDNVVLTELPSVICLEQTKPGQFVRHTLQTGCPNNSSLEMADFDNDGDLDFAIGCHSLDPTKSLPYWVAVWWNNAR